MKKLLTIILLFILGIVRAQVPNYVPTNGLVGWWPFHGNTIDESGNGNDGIGNGVTLNNDRIGAINQAYLFSPTSTNSIDISLSNPVTNEFSIMMWLKPNRVANFISESSVCPGSTSVPMANSNQNWAILPNNNLSNLGVGLSVGTNGIMVAEHANNLLVSRLSYQQSINDFVNVIVIYRTDSTFLYVDGNLVRSRQIHCSGSSKIIPANFVLGGSLYSPTFSGIIDDLGIWDRPLTVNEINNLASSYPKSLKVFRDVNEDCNLDFAEVGIQGMLVEIQPGNIITTTNTGGLIYLDNLPPGNYTATLDTTNSQWATNCNVIQPFSISASTANTVDFGLFSNFPCSEPDVTIFAPSLRRCSEHTVPICVSVCNQITAINSLDSSYVQVVLDEDIFDVVDANLPLTQIAPDTFSVFVGDVLPGNCVNFTINAFITCVPQLDETVCMEASLFPVHPCALDSISSTPVTPFNINPGTLNGLPQPCTLPWDQSSLSVDGWCQNDTIYFTITNTGVPGGGDMECYSPVWITIDGVVTYTDSIMISGGQTITYTFPGNGATWILNAEQHPLHPGNSHPNAHVEACGDTTNWSPGIIEEFPEDDADPIVDIYCGRIVGSYDPNDKKGYPLGQTTEHFIQPNQQLQYVVRFQNTGTDTAFLVVVRDTLDSDLNIFTVVPGVASHPYSFRMYGPRVMEWTFENIDLVDSTTNLAASQGFLTYHVEQNPDLIDGTTITNDADIYFDQNPPITTNLTLQTIFRGFVSVLTVENSLELNNHLMVYPNPFENQLTIIAGENMHHTFSVFDQQGRILLSGKLKGLHTTISTHSLSKGTYILHVEGNYQPVILLKSN